MKKDTSDALDKLSDQTGISKGLLQSIAAQESSSEGKPLPQRGVYVGVSDLTMLFPHQTLPLHFGGTNLPVLTGASTGERSAPSFIVDDIPPVEAESIRGFADTWLKHFQHGSAGEGRYHMPKGPEYRQDMIFEKLGQMRVHKAGHKPGGSMRNKKRNRYTTTGLKIVARFLATAAYPVNVSDTMPVAGEKDMVTMNVSFNAENIQELKG